MVVAESIAAPIEGDTGAVVLLIPDPDGMAAEG